MKLTDKIFVLEFISKIPNLEIRKFKSDIGNSIPWIDFLNIYKQFTTKGYIKKTEIERILGGTITDLGIKELDELKKENDRHEEVKSLTLKKLKGNVFQLRYWWVILIFSGIIGFISGNIILIVEWLKELLK